MIDEGRKGPRENRVLLVARIERTKPSEAHERRRRERREEEGESEIRKGGPSEPKEGEGESQRRKVVGSPLENEVRRKG